MDYIKSYKKESPFLNMIGMGGGVSSLLTLASGEATYIEDVFSTFLYDGTASSQTITNGIDLDGEGGLVWAKSRSSRNHILSDTERGTGKVLFTNLTSGTDTDATTITSYNSNGFTMGTSTLKMNTSGEEFVSWTFRKCPGFFDIVTWTANGSVQQLSHNLGSVPGMIIVKRTDDTSNWLIWHRSLSNSLNDFLRFDTADKQSAVGVWGNNAPTSDYFEFQAQTSGREFIAYVFAHNDGSFGEDSDEAVIKCDTYAGSGSDGNKITLGFEPQWLLIKNIDDNATDWVILDIMRGANYITGNHLRANLNSQEYGNTDLRVDLHADGFSVNANNTMINGTSGENFIYIAIRRPHKPPEAGTDVFNPSTQVGTVPNFSSTFPVDFAIKLFTSGGNTTYAQLAVTRLLGERYLATSQTNAEASPSGFSIDWDHMDGWGDKGGLGTGLSFKRAPGFMDVVAVESTTSAASTFNHNLGATPEFILAKRRDGTGHWYADQVNYYLRLNTDDGNLGTPVFNTLTSTQFSVDAGTFSSGESWIVFLFASLDGISKVGSYTGTGSDGNNIDCGFTNGARFVMVKRTDSSGDWFVADTSRGINAGSDPFMKLNTTDAENNTVDWIDTYNAGFTINGTGGDFNASGGNYIFLAIA